MNTTLSSSMREAWFARAQREADFVSAAAKAPALFKLAAVEASPPTYRRAMGFVKAWS